MKNKKEKRIVEVIDTEYSKIIIKYTPDNTNAYAEIIFKNNNESNIND